MPIKTKIYIDGYNLYYGCLKYTEHKWLGIHQLFADRILKTQSPDSEIFKIKYFTADIKSKMASQGKAALHAQARYHRALENIYPEKIEIGIVTPIKKITRDNKARLASSSLAVHADWTRTYILENEL